MSMLKSVVFPADWTTIPFGRVAPRVQDSGRPDLESLSVFLGAGVVPRSSREDNHNQLGEDMGKYLVVEPGDIVFNKLRTWQGGLGASKYLGLVSPAYFVCRPKPNFDPTFLQYLLLSSTYLQELTRISKWQPPSQFDIGWEQLKLLPTVAPDLARQKAIAEYLDRETVRIDALIEKKQRQIKLIEERFNADGLNIISGVSSDFENSSDKSGSVNRSSEWLPLKLAWCLKTGSGTTPTSGTANYYSEDGIPWVTTAELREDVILKTSMGVTDEARRNFSALRIFPIGTVLVAMYGATVGRAAVLGIEACVNQACCAIFGQGRIKIDFFYWWARLHRQDLIDLGYGSGQPNISQDTIRSLRIDTPSLEQQEAIVHYLANSWARTEALLNMTKQHIQLLVERKQSMITAAVTGELEIPGVAA